MNTEDNIPVITTSALRAQLQSLDDHAILTIVLEEGDDEDNALGNGNDSHTSLGAATYAGGSNDACKENERHSAG